MVISRNLVEQIISDQTRNSFQLSDLFEAMKYKIDHNSASVDSNPLKLCEWKVAGKIQSIMVAFQLSGQHSWF